MLIIDGQIHPPHPSFGHDPVDAFKDEYDPTVKDLLPVELTVSSMDAVGVTGAIVHPAALGPHDEANISHLYTSTAPTRFRVVPSLDPTHPEIDSQVAAVAADPMQVGVRAVMAWPPSGEGIKRFHDGVYDALFSSLQSHSVTLFVFVFQELKTVETIARRYPDLQVVIDHFGLEQRPIYQLREDPWDRLDELLGLAQFPNVVVKACGAPAMSTTEYPFPDVWPHVHRVLEAFGLDRTFWASDYTRVAPDHSYSDALDWVRRTTELSDTDKEALLGGTVQKLWGWHDVAALQRAWDMSGGR